MDPRHERAHGVVEVGPPARPDATPAGDLGRADQLRPDPDRREDLDLRRPDQPGDPALGVPRPPEPATRRVVRRPGPACSEQDGGPDPPVRAGTRRTGPGTARSSDRARAGSRPGAARPSSVSSGHELGRLVRRRLARKPDIARSPGVEHDEGDREPFVLLGRVRPRVVELVQDVGVDARARPTCSRMPRPPRRARRSRRTDGSRRERHRTGSAARDGPPPGRPGGRGAARSAPRRAHRGPGCGPARPGRRPPATRPGSPRSVPGRRRRRSPPGRTGSGTSPASRPGRSSRRS